MLNYPQIDPVAIALGPLQIHWYGLMYLVGFAGGWLLARYRASLPHSNWTPQQVDDLLFFTALGIVLGGRLGYALFYHFDYVVENPWWLFQVWQGGMSFHGGLLGVIVALAWYAHRQHKAFLAVTDFVAPMVPLGLGAGRIGNFIGGELWGKATQVPWGMVFPRADHLARHPSQLYEFFLEGVVLFGLLWWYSAYSRPRGAVSGVFLLGYGLSRFIVEFFREPDAHLGYLAFNWFTMGQLLTLPMIILGMGFILWGYTQNRKL